MTTLLSTPKSHTKLRNANRLEALAVDDCRTALVVLLLADPHLLEGRKGSKDGATDPDGVLTLRRSDDLDLHGGRSKSSHLLLHTVSDTVEHGGTTRHNDVAVKVLTDIDIALHDGVEGGLMDTRGFHAKEGRLEENLRAAETLVADGDDLTIRKLVALLELRGGGSLLHLSVEVKGDVAELLLDITDDLTLGSGGEGITTLHEDLHEVVSKITTGKIDTEDSMRKSITLIDGDSVRHTITSIKHDTSGTTRGIKGI